MADAVLLLLAQLGHGAVETVHDEQRIVAKATRSARLAGDAPVAASVDAYFAICTGPWIHQSDGASKTSASVLIVDVLHLLEQLGVVLRVRRTFGGTVYRADHRTDRRAFSAADERADGHAVSSIHLQFLQPMASGIGEILPRFKKVMTVENSWSDPLGEEIIDEENRRYSGLAWLLRAKYLVDIDCWGQVRGQPIKPGAIEQVIRDRLS